MTSPPKFECKLCNMVFDTNGLRNTSSVTCVCSFCRREITPRHIPKEQEIQYFRLRHKDKTKVEEDRRTIKNLKITPFHYGQIRDN